MTSADPSLRYLTATEVVAAMPPLDERLRLAERTMVALVHDADLPPKIGVHPRPSGSFAHAMPAHLRGTDASGAADLLGIKWIAGFPGNAARGLSALHGLVVLNDPSTGLPAAILDAGPITAERTAAVSGVAIERFRREAASAPAHVAILGAGVQARSHLPVVGRVLPGAEVVVYDRHPERADELVALAAATAGIADARRAETARDAALDADVVVTVASFAPADRRQTMTTDWLAPDALVVAVDYATYVAAGVARDAALFVVDQLDQFLANRDAGNFDGYPDPATTLGEAILADLRRPHTGGRIVVTHLGVGLADLVFADAILRRATELGLGTALVTAR
jgi:ornithine cyclodeaminase/alanine dehydrogenase-like protein (mu-crystallin family)